MKAYQYVVSDIVEFFKTDFGILILIIVGMVLFATGSHKLGERGSQARIEEIAWCMDQGGRRVNIDGINDCFQLTEVLLESETLTTQERECTRVPTQTYIKAAGGNLYFCYSFKRINREN